MNHRDQETTEFDVVDRRGFFDLDRSVIMEAGLNLPEACDIANQCEGVVVFGSGEGLRIPWQHLSTRLRWTAKSTIAGNLLDAALDGGEVIGSGAISPALEPRAELEAAIRLWHGHAFRLSLEIPRYEAGELVAYLGGRAVVALMLSKGFPFYIASEAVGLPVVLPLRERVRARGHLPQSVEEVSGRTMMKVRRFLRRTRNSAPATRGGK